MDANSPSVEFDAEEPWFEETRRETSKILEDFQKPVSGILNTHKNELKGFQNIHEIVVIGHSINDIDAPYLKLILNSYPKAQWLNFNYINDEEGVDEVEETHQKLLSLGVPSLRLGSYSSELLSDFFPMP